MKQAVIFILLVGLGSSLEALRSGHFEDPLHGAEALDALIDYDSHLHGPLHTEDHHHVFHDGALGHHHDHLAHDVVSHVDLHHDTHANLHHLEDYDQTDLHGLDHHIDNALHSLDDITEDAAHREHDLQHMYDHLIDHEIHAGHHVDLHGHHEVLHHHPHVDDHMLHHGHDLHHGHAFLQHLDHHDLHHDLHHDAHHDHHLLQELDHVNHHLEDHLEHAAHHEAHAHDAAHHALDHRLATPAHRLFPRPHPYFYGGPQHGPYGLDHRDLDVHHDEAHLGYHWHDYWTDVYYPPHVDHKEMPFHHYYHFPHHGDDPWHYHLHHRDWQHFHHGHPRVLYH